MIKSDIVDLTEVENMAESVAREIDKEEMLSQELVGAIRELLTKQCIKVMIDLYNNRLNNKELAKAMNIASNNLSNTLQRIKSSQLNLLIIEHESRNTYYSLSEIGKKYTEKYLLCDVPKRENVKNTSTQKGIYALNNMKKAWGMHWELKLDEILIAYFDKTYSFEIDYCGQEENFKQFINSIRSVDETLAQIFEKKERKYIDEVDRVYEAVHMDIYDDIFGDGHDGINENDIKQYQKKIGSIYQEKPYKDDLIKEDEEEMVEEYDEIIETFKEAVNADISTWELDDLWKTYEAGRELLFQN